MLSKGHSVYVSRLGVSPWVHTWTSRVHGVSGGVKSWVKAEAGSHRQRKGLMETLPMEVLCAAGDSRD